MNKYIEDVANSALTEKEQALVNGENAKKLLKLP